MKTVCIFLATGFEEVEAITTIDLLRRGGVEVKMVSLTDSLLVLGGNGISVQADLFFADLQADEMSGFILPGGMGGVGGMMVHAGLQDLILKMSDAGKVICAICAAPMLLGAWGLVEGKTATIYPGMEEHLLGAIPKTDSVCVDGNIITSRGVGTAIEFALQLIATFNNQETSDAVRKGIVYQQ
ncbi:DJ-1 family glyoxalase III [Chakrabartyella piscis]|uniref:DJ-1 family glyoxalase III n=1 Tax=Chakrabartyella piscis TaxID=2918914 RepID=UPI002958C5AE|nr:DJ-1 family glyoxalase III [Chakrabartyella piscis]